MEKGFGEKFQYRFIENGFLFVAFVSFYLLYINVDSSFSADIYIIIDFEYHLYTKFLLRN